MKHKNLFKVVMDMVFQIALIILLSILVGLILAFPTMWLWNFIFGGFLSLNVFQAWALNILAGILISSKTDKSG